MNATALYKALTEAGASEDTAERAVEGLPPGGELATKSDLVQLGARLDTDIAQLGARLDTDIAQLGADIAQLEVRLGADIAQLEVRLTWRLLGGVAVLLGITSGVLKLLLG